MMSSYMKTMEVHSVKVVYDKEKTENYRTEYNKPCICSMCQNYYRNIENNQELISFLSEFGIDYRYTEEIFSYDLGDKKDSWISSEAYYGVEGDFDGEGFSFEQCGLKISFVKGANIPHDRAGKYFWIIVNGVFPYILEEEKDWIKKSWLERIKEMFKKH